MTASIDQLPGTVSSLTITRVAGRIGGEVRGVQLSGEIDDALVREMRQALCRYKVLFFRDQDQFDDAAHQAFGKRFGVPTLHPTAPDQVGDFLLELDSQHGGKANAWHTDLTFMARYPEASILRAVTIPPYGGDTVWANTVEAYNRLPDSLRTLADSLWAVHSNDYDYAANQTEPDPETDAYHQQFISKVFEAEHPLVRVHPETGERSLVLGSFFKQFVGLSYSDSRRLYETFQAHIVRLENAVRWQWREGDVAIWDNRATQHYAIDDYDNQRRVVRRVTVDGDVPVSVDGRSSRQLKPAEVPSLRVA